jgi:NADPH-dependent curcumin reductase CurA
MRAGGAGKVIASKHPQFKAGDEVAGNFGVQQYALSDGKGVRKVDTRFAPLTTYLGALGMPGMTAYFGLLDIGKPKAGETVVVSGAAGAVGSVVGQIAKIKGCRVIGIAGGESKCRYLTDELGFDAAIDYKGENVMTRLRQTCPKGIDLYFDNVGGRMLEAALANLALHGRIVICGAISGYNAAVPPPGPKNYLKLLTQRGRMEGFVVIDFLPRAAEALEALATFMREGKLKDQVDVQHGLENAPAALARLFRGENQGKQLVKVAEPTRALLGEG